VIRNSIIPGSPIAMQKHQGASPKNPRVVHNTAITKGFAIHLGCANDRGVSLVGNLGIGEISGSAKRLPAPGLTDIHNP
jgi:hypothetical protein